VALPIIEPASCRRIGRRAAKASSRAALGRRRRERNWLIAVSLPAGTGQVPALSRPDESRKERTVRSRLPRTQACGWWWRQVPW